MAKLTLTRMTGGYLTTAAVNTNQVLTEAALENTLSRDGTTPNVMNADIDMNSSGRITNLQDAVQNQEPITLAQAATLQGITTVLSQDTVAAVFWPQSALETANSSTATELQYYYGDVRRYGAKLDGATDDTAAFNAAIGSGYGGYCDNGTAAITGTILIKTMQTLTCKAEVVLQRFAGDATTPVIHMYGNLARFFGGGCAIRQNLYDHPDGIVLFGPDPGETATEGTDVQCYNMQFHDAKIIGPENTAPNSPIQLGSPGFYVHSLKRKGGAFINATYKCIIANLQILNCDVGIEFSSDANSNFVTGVYLNQWLKAAIYFNAAYGNQLIGVMMESPLADTTARRYAIQFEAQNSGVESGTLGTYAIDSAYRNHISCYAELPNSGSSVVSLFRHTESGTVFGNNWIVHVGTLSAGIGIDGVSDETAMGTNSYDGIATNRQRGRIHDFNGWSFRLLDDSTDLGYMTKDSWACLTGRADSIAEGTQKNIFSMEGIGPNTAAAMIKLSYVAKADAIASAQIGEVTWAVWQETTSNYFVRKIAETMTTFDETQIVTPNITVGVGDVATEMLATVGFLTASPAGTNQFFFSWKCEVISSETEGNADLDDNLSNLAPAAGV